MSRIGQKPIPVPKGVTVTCSGNTVNVEGPKGKLSWEHRPEITARVDEAAAAVIVERQDDQRSSRALHGLTRSLIANMVSGCLEGYSRALELYGVGYGVQLQGRKLSVTCGYSHPVVIELPAGIAVDVATPQARGDTDPARFTVQGIDKQMVGEIAARIRRVRPPEPYKGKGIRYADERVRRKVGKQFAAGG